MAKKKKNNVLIMAGGTGGHVFPALAVAKELKAEGVNVHWLGTRRGLESELVPKADIPISYLSITGLRGKGMLSLLLAPFRMIIALIQAANVIIRFKPNAVLGMGGFASGPGGVAAWLLRKPLIIHEQNAIAGYTNRALAKIAKHVLAAFPYAFPNKRDVVTTGNPVRKDIASLPAPSQRFSKRSGPMRVVVLGGSRGALAINELLPETMAKLKDAANYDIWHQTGSAHYDATKRRYDALGVKAKIEPFIDDMKKAYGWADLVLCRSGALTITELAAAGVASILIPYPYAVDDHQTHNGQVLVKAGAALLIQQNILSAETLMDLLKEFDNDRPRLLEMATAARSLVKQDAAKQVADFCLYN